MSQQSYIPVLPESAPFTAEQRAYLNGFFAGLFSRGPAGGPAGMPVPSQALQPLTILFGSQTGNAEKLAKKIAKEAGKHGFAPTIHEMAKYPTTQLADEQCVLIVTSTYGDGDPPDNAKSFWEALSGDAAPRLANLRFSVCALGDSNYPKFCAFGKSVDARLAALGGQRVHACVECDVDFDEPFLKWLSAAISALPKTGAATATPDVAFTASQLDDEPEARFGKHNPFPAKLTLNRRLTGEGSAKDTRHIGFSLEGSDLIYEAGDALGVVPANCEALVADLVQALGCSGDETVPGAKGAEVTLHEALHSHYEIARISPALLKEFAMRTGDETLNKVVQPDANGELTRFLRGREVIDLLLSHPSVRLSPAEFIALLRKLQPRLYSIASSPKAHPGEVHLCVGVVRYESLGRARKGVCSTFLADRAPDQSLVPVYVHASSNFRPPADPDRPMIMVGPGTGIAPFRAFLEERCETGAIGRNWLFFGDQRGGTDFLFRDEIEAAQKDGVLHRLDLAFSRDQEQKVYVQHRMLEHAKDLFAWLEDGGHFYVCGDASRMAKDVDVALKSVIETAGAKTPEQAAEYVSRLETEKRYVRDVY